MHHRMAMINSAYNEEDEQEEDSSNAAGDMGQMTDPRSSASRPVVGNPYGLSATGKAEKTNFLQL